MEGELEVLEELSHPNIMVIYELLEDEKFYFIISEFVRGGELFNFVVERSKDKKEGALTESEVQKISIQLFKALNYMHKNKIVHRDIKPENILIDGGSEINIKLTDFGFATYFNEGSKLN